jgi:hypothetical protein
VFEGTVRKEKATAMEAVPATDRTAIVRVDRIVQAPEVFADFGGQDVTVRLSDDEGPIKTGQTYVFYTNGLVFGDGLAVQSLGHEKASRTMTAALSIHPSDPVRSLQSQEAMTQAANAALIVSGRVSAVRLPKPEAQARAALAAGKRQTTLERISEHAPLWQEAVIDIDEVHRGSHKSRQVVVRFPSSTDVRWHKAPKFHAGLEAVFLLHTDQLPPKSRMALELGGVGPAEYTALDPGDVQPLEELPQIMAAVKTPKV